MNIKKSVNKSKYSIMYYFFCRGVILFAMVNGRLPFNDAQLVEMEEEMKMQRLRFERNISFGKISSHYLFLME